MSAAASRSGLAAEASFACVTRACGPARHAVRRHAAPTSTVGRARRSALVAAACPARCMRWRRRRRQFPSSDADRRAADRDRHDRRRLPDDHGADHHRCADPDDARLCHRGRVGDGHQRQPGRRRRRAHERSLGGGRLHHGRARQLHARRRSRSPRSITTRPTRRRWRSPSRSRPRFGGGGDRGASRCGARRRSTRGDLMGASVLVAMGNDTADKTLDELQGIATTTTTAAPSRQLGVDATARDRRPAAPGLTALLAQLGVGRARGRAPAAPRAPGG